MDLDSVPVRARTPHGVPRSATSKALKAKWMADNPTPGEAAFRHILMSLGIEHEFQTQAQIAGFIVDFYHCGLRTDGKVCRPFVVEIDGASHFTAAGKKKDAERTRALKRTGVSQVIRFTNTEVIKNRKSILQVVMSARGN
jgi:very-short-patch-repair endonuclease